MMQNLLAHVHPDRWTVLWTMLTEFAVNLCTAVLVLGIGWWLSKLVGGSLDRLFKRQSSMDHTLRPILCDVAVWGIRIVAIVGALSQLGIQTASIVAVLGAAGLAIGLALQGTMQNIAAGIMLLLLRPFKVGDYIDGGGGSVAGTVEEVSLFTTRLVKPDGICEYVPNSALWSNSIRNYTRNPTRRLDLEVDVSLHDDVNRAIEALREMAARDPRVLSDPPPEVMVNRFEDSVAILNIRVWSKTEVFWEMRWALASRLRATLAEAHCALPLRQRALHIVRDVSGDAGQPEETRAPAR